MIVRSRVVVTMDGPPIENGAVFIVGDRVGDVGTFSGIRKIHPGNQIVDLGEQALLPGLINAHCHLDYTCLRGKIAQQKSFTDWIRAINAEKAKLSADDYVVSINEGFAEAKRFGTTAIANLTGLPELISRVPSPIRTWWFPELIDVRQQISDENLDAVCRQVSKAARHWGLAPHAPFTASANLYERCEEIARREDILLTTHLAESGEEMSMFRDAQGLLYDFLKEIGRDMNDCGRATPLANFLERISEGDRPYLLVHLNELSAGDLAKLQESREAHSVVHCPRTHKYFGRSPFQFEKLSKLGLNICLGTDSLASNDNLSLFAEMRAFQKEFPNLRPVDILKMVTVNSAKALRQQNVLGRISPGFVADMVTVPIENAKSAVDELMAFGDTVRWSMIGGRISP